MHPAELSGVFNIMATPFTPQYKVDQAGLAGLVEFQIRAGAAGLTILGIMGEFQKLSDAERLQVTETVLRQVDGRLPVVVGVSHTGTQVVVDLSRQAEALGAAAVMVAPPAGLRNLDAVRSFYDTVAGAIRIPVVVQDEPVTTGVIMPASFVARLVTEIPNCRYIKLEEPPVPQKISQIRKLAADARIFGGLGGQYFLSELERGAIGTMTGFAFTEILVSIHADFRAGRPDQARATFYRYLPLISYEGQAGVGLAIRKEILQRRGAFTCAAIRSPGTALDDTSRAEISRLLSELDLQP